MTVGYHQINRKAYTITPRLFRERLPHRYKVSMSQPAEIYKVDPKTGKDTELSFVNKGILDQLTMGKVESRWIKTTDNKQMLTWIIYPPHFDPNKKYPAILYCRRRSSKHGKPILELSLEFPDDGSQRLHHCCPGTVAVYRDSGKNGTSKSAVTTPDKTSRITFLPSTR